MRNLIFFGLIVVLFFVLFGLTTYSVGENELVVVNRFGEIVDSETNAGLYFKLPFFDQINVIDGRMVFHDMLPESILTVDKKRLEIDCFMIWQVKDSVKFYDSLKTIESAKSNLEDIVYSNIRNVFAKKYTEDIINSERDAALEIILNNTGEAFKDFGIEVKYVNVKRSNLPQANENAVFERMRSERSKEAAKIRAEGDMIYKSKVAQADSESSVIMAKADKDAEIIKGDGDSQAIKIYADSFSKDPEFFEFWKSLSTYETSFASDTKFFLEGNSDFLKHLDLYTDDLTEGEDDVR
jgi:membrane protease subunit HflC